MLLDPGNNVEHRLIVLCGYVKNVLCIAAARDGDFQAGRRHCGVPFCEKDVAMRQYSIKISLINKRITFTYGKKNFQKFRQVRL